MSTLCNSLILKIQRFLVTSTHATLKGCTPILRHLLHPPFWDYFHPIQRSIHTPWHSFWSHYVADGNKLDQLRLTIILWQPSCHEKCCQEAAFTSVTSALFSATSWHVNEPPSPFLPIAKFTFLFNTYWLNIPFTTSRAAISLPH